MLNSVEIRCIVNELEWMMVLLVLVAVHCGMMQ